MLSYACVYVRVSLLASPQPTYVSVNAFVAHLRQSLMWNGRG